MIRIIKIFIRYVLTHHALLWVGLFYRDIWQLKEHINNKQGTKLKNYIRRTIYYSYFEHYSAYIGINSVFKDNIIFPHEFNGIFISENAVIGNNVVIFQQVTIGSNNLSDSIRRGSPTIGDNVYIGAGAKIIGKITIGNNVRIGANCIVTKDVPSNCVCVMRGLDIVCKEDKFNNTYISL